MRVVLDGITVRERSHRVLEHLLVDAEVGVRVGVAVRERGWYELSGGLRYPWLELSCRFSLVSRCHALGRHLVGGSGGGRSVDLHV